MNHFLVKAKSLKTNEFIYGYLWEVLGNDEGVAYLSGEPIWAHSVEACTEEEKSEWGYGVLYKTPKE